MKSCVVITTMLNPRNYGLCLLQMGNQLKNFHQCTQHSWDQLEYTAPGMLVNLSSERFSIRDLELGLGFRDRVQ